MYQSWSAARAEAFVTVTWNQRCRCVRRGNKNLSEWMHREEGKYQIVEQAWPFSSAAMHLSASCPSDTLREHRFRAGFAYAAEGPPCHRVMPHCQHVPCRRGDSKIGTKKPETHRLSPRGRIQTAYLSFLEAGSEQTPVLLQVHT